MHTTRRLSLILGLLILVPTAPLYAWFGEGHCVIALIAYDELAKTPQGKEHLKEMAALLRDYLPYPRDFKAKLPATADDREIFAEAATWADVIKNTRDPEVKSESHKPWHYIDQPIKLTDTTQLPVMPLSTKPLDPADPNFSNMNILQALAYNRSVWKTTKNPREKAIVLAWILHLVGDLHQPLHAAALYSNHFDTVVGDEGGNLILIGDPAAATTPKPNEELLTTTSPATRAGSRSFFKPELHAFWDGAYTTEKTPDINQLEESIIQEYKRSAFDAALLAAGDEAIAQESFDLAKNEAYTATILKAIQALDPTQPAPVIDGKIPRAVGPIELTHDYKKNALALARKRLALAGYRLAAQLAP